MSQAFQDTTPTLQDVINTVNTSFTAVTVEIHGMKEDIHGMKEDIHGMKEDIHGMKEDIAHIQATMVTKDYLDDKLSDLKGEVINLVRKEDHKLNTVVALMHTHKVLSDSDLQQIDQVQLFPKTTAI